MTDYEQANRDLRAGVEALILAAWDDGNATGLDGWIGPERGEEPDAEGIRARERFADRAAALLASSAPATASEDATEPIHDDDCDSRGCTHCEVCGVGVLYGSRCSAHPMPGSSGAVALTAIGVTSSDGDRGLSEPLVDLWRDVAKSGITDGVDYPGIVLALIAERAARTAQPEGVERVEWGVQYGDGDIDTVKYPDGEVATQIINCEGIGPAGRVRAEQEIADARADIADPTSSATADDYEPMAVVRRRVTEFAPVLGPWEAVGDE